MTWTATERTIDPIPELDGSWRPEKLAIDIRDQHTNIVCLLAAPADDHAAVQQMRARARLICQAEAMWDALDDMALAMEMGLIKKTTKARAILERASWTQEDFSRAEK